MAETCTWARNTDDESDMMYETACRNAFLFTDGGPKDNEFRYCCYCGKPLEVNHYTYDEGEGVTEVLASPSTSASGMAQAAGEGQQAAGELLEMIEGHQYGLRGFGDGSLSRGRNLTDNERWIIRKALALYATSPAVAPSAQPTVVREFTNELGNRIRITIEGPTSTSENILTPREVDELKAALSSIGAAPSAQEPQAAEQSELITRIDAAIQRVVDGNANMRIPADPTDPDLVLADCKRALLAATKQPAQVPVGWRVRGYSQFKTGAPGPWRYFDGPAQPKINDPECCDIEPVFATAPSAPAAPVVTADAVRDAQRYQWLRAEHQRMDPMCHLAWKRNNDRNGSEWVNTANLDAAVDAAMHSTDAREEEK